jgi:hypothetical protein
LLYASGVGAFPFSGYFVITLTEFYYYYYYYLIIIKICPKVARYDNVGKLRLLTELRETNIFKQRRHSVYSSGSPPLQCDGGSAAVRTVKPVIAGRMRLVQHSLELEYKRNTSVFERSRQAIAMATFSNEEYADIHCIY